MNWKVGDRVRMSTEGKYQWGDTDGNPHNLIGTVTSTDLEDYCKRLGWTVAVNWANGHTSYYAPEYLEKADPEPSQKPARELGRALLWD